MLVCHLQRLPVRRWPLRIELSQEQGAPPCFGLLAQGLRGRAQGVERSQEPAVRFVDPTHVSGAAPTGGPQGVEAAVITDPRVRVRLDIVTGQPAEFGPTIQEGRIGRDHGGHRVPPLTFRGR